MEIGPQYIDYLAGADTGGLAADGDGAVPSNLDRQPDGIGQLWTSGGPRRRSAAVNGSAELAALADLTQSVAVEFSNTAYDPKSHVVSLDAALTNTSEKPLFGPVRLRVISVASGSSVPEILDADNRLPGAGALWDFTSASKDRRLGPGETSRPKRLRFRLNELVPFRLDQRQRLDNLISVDAKVLGKSAP